MREGKWGEREGKRNDNRYKKCGEERNCKALKRKGGPWKERKKVCESHTADL